MKNVLTANFGEDYKGAGSHGGSLHSNSTHGFLAYSMVASTSDSSTRTVNAITADIPQAIHAALNADIKIMLLGVPLESREVQVLFYVISASVEAYRNTSSPIIPPTIMALGDLLESNPDLKRLLLEAYQSGDYTEIRRRRE